MRLAIHAAETGRPSGAIARDAIARAAKGAEPAEETPASIAAIEHELARPELGESRRQRSLPSPGAELPGETAEERAVPGPRAARSKAQACAVSCSSVSRRSESER
jgi:hypothetical protein